MAKRSKSGAGADLPEGEDHGEDASSEGEDAGQGSAAQLKIEIDLLGLSAEGRKRLQAYVAR